MRDYELRRAWSHWLYDLAKPSCVHPTFEACLIPAKEDVPDFEFVEPWPESEPRLEATPTGAHRHPFDLELLELAVALKRMAERKEKQKATVNERERRLYEMALLKYDLQHKVAYWRGRAEGLQREIEYKRRRWT